MKWVGSATAILTLLFALQRVVTSITETRDKRRQSNELLNTAKTQQRDGLYEEALATLQKAEPLHVDDDGVRSLQEDVAMDWARHARKTAQQEWADVVRKFQPILARGASSVTESKRRADLTAHLGWSNFLLWQDGKAAPPEAQYRRAVELDSTNAYAHAMWGHWILWQHGPIDQARKHFVAAVASRNNRDFVRYMQIAALKNARDSAASAEVIRVANEMRMQKDTIAPEVRRTMAELSCLDLSSPLRSADLARRPAPIVISPQEDRLAVEWIFDSLSVRQAEDVTRDYCIAVIEESAGQSARALTLYKSVRQRLPKFSMLESRTDAAIQRLSRK